MTEFTPTKTSAFAVALHRLRQFVHADPGLQARLFKATDNAELWQALQPTIAALALELDEATLMRAGRGKPRLTGINAADPTKHSTNKPAPGGRGVDGGFGGQVFNTEGGGGQNGLHGWIPFFLSRLDCQPTVEWGYIGQQRYTEPFFDDTLQRLLAHPFNRVFRQHTPLDTLTERVHSHPGLPLHGLIFHMSRCGSTLVAQAFAALSDSVVLSEPASLGILLEWQIAAPSGDAGAAASLLRGLLSALGQPCRTADRRLFLKTECWHICHIDRLLTALPGVPWVFLYREPLQVLASHARMPSVYLMPGTGIHHGLMPPAALLTQPLQHAAWMLGRIMADASAALSRYPNGLLVDYCELPEAIETRIADHFGLYLQAADIAALRHACLRDAKKPEAIFLPDSADKQAVANADLRDAASRWLDGPYAELSALARAYCF